MQPSNILKIESLGDGWCDKDHVMLHACFQLLSDFVEKEMKVNSYPDWEASVETKNAKKEIEELYSWWQEWKKDEQQDHGIENEMLKRLIDVRMHLWT